MYLSYNLKTQMLNLSNKGSNQLCYCISKALVLFSVRRIKNTYVKSSILCTYILNECINLFVFCLLRYFKLRASFSFLTNIQKVDYNTYKTLRSIILYFTHVYSNFLN